MRPVLVVRIANRSDKAICIRAAALENPYSGEMTTRLRDSRGRIVKLRERGIAPLPKEGVIRLDPKGGQTSGKYFLDSRFALATKGKQFPRRMSAQVAFRYGYCDDVWALQATSSWQPV